MEAEDLLSSLVEAKGALEDVLDRLRANGETWASGDIEQALAFVHRAIAELGGGPTPGRA